MRLDELWAILGGPPGFHAFSHGGRVSWIPVGEQTMFVARCEQLGQHGDLKVCAVPFRTRDYTRPGDSSVLWVKAETPDARERLSAFGRAPTVVLAAGAHRTALWALTQPLTPAWTVALNRRLAHRLGCKLKHGGMWFHLHPPGTVLREGRARPVVVEVGQWTGDLHGARAVAGGLPDPPENSWNGS